MGLASFSFWSLLCVGNRSLASLSLILLVLLVPVVLQNENFPKWILWNIGQGQFLTFSDPQTCWHFDMGGDKAPWAEITRECQGKSNRLSLSHWDWDHISMVSKGNAVFTQFCVDREPLGPPPSPNKADVLKGTKPCLDLPRSLIEISWRGPKQKTSNELSRVYYGTQEKILIPGDSPSNQERFWAIQNQYKISQTKFLVLGHHGSTTSTSALLLNYLPQLKMGLVSAKKNRYGHPHQKIVQRCRQKGIPIIQTEYWGHLVIPARLVPTFGISPN
jgi:competence protein ComEC